MDYNREQRSIDTNDEILQMRKKLKKRKNAHRKIIIISSAIAAAIAVLVIVLVVNMTYSSYEIISSTGKEDSQDASYVEYQNGYIRYSQDGAQYVDSGGNEIWNLTYSILNPHFDFCGDNIVISDIGLNKIIIIDKNGSKKEINTSQKIVQTKTSDKGAIVAVLQDEGRSYINLYNLSGEVVYSIKTTLEGEGYPLDVDVSNDATKLVTSYVKLDGNDINSKVVVYNFGKNGKNKEEDNNNIIAEFSDFGDKLVGDIEFLTDKTAVAVAEDALYYYEIDDTPEQKKRVEQKNKISKVITGDKKIGLILESNEEGVKNRIELYNSSGGKIAQKNLQESFTKYRINSDAVIMTGQNTFAVMNFSGKFITCQNTDNKIVDFVNNGGRRNYFLISEKYIQRIRLK